MSGISDVEAAVSFIAQFIIENGDNHVPFHSCSLSEAIVEACFAPFEERKILALYLHNASDPFSKMFCPALVTGEVRNIIENTFYLLGWDVSDTLYHSALRKSLDENLESDQVKLMMSEKRAVLFLLYPTENCIAIHSVIYGATVKVKELVTALQEIEKKFKTEIENDIELERITKEVQSQNDIGSKEFQQLMYDRLGDRDYDCFEFDKHEHLKEKIGFAIFGPPQVETGYDEKQNKKIQETYEKVRQENNYYAEWQEQIVISFIYNCLEPLLEEKLKRMKEYPDYNPKTDIMPVPIYVIRKCRGSENPCRLFIDCNNRVYNTWHDYIKNNKLHKCTMVLPKDGRYMGDESGSNVLLETHPSPSCRIGQTVIQQADIATTAAGLASGGIFIAAMAVPVAPLALTAAAVTGAAVGVYSIFRSGSNIYDRYVHKESLSFANSEARGAYINITAGTLGFVGAGATTAISHLAANGVNIEQGAQAAVNAINMMNVSASGIGIANATYQVYDAWYNVQQAPSWLTVVQLSSSILFFGNAVYNFRTAGTIIEETQTNALKSYHESLRSNRHRKTFNKMMKETIRQNSGDVQAGQAEVISTIRTLGNKDEIFAILTRNNKLFNKKGIRFSAEGGEIKLNGMSVDVHEFGSMNNMQKSQYLIDLPSTPQPSATQIKVNTSKTISSIQTVFELENVSMVVKYGQLITTGCTFTTVAANLLQDFSTIIQEKILRICKALVDHLLGSMDILKIIKEYFSGEPLAILLQFVIDFLKVKMNSYEQQYETARREAMQLPNFNEEEFNRTWRVHPETGRRAIFWFEKIVNIFVNGGAIDENLLRELSQYVRNLLTERIVNRLEEEERAQRRETTTRNVRRISCSICGGYYFGENH